MTKHLMHTYNRLPVTFTRGEAASLWDSEGKQYLDAISGIAVCGLGHANKDIANAIYEQAKTLVHTSNLYQIENQKTLGDQLCEISGLENAFFCNSGAEANEAAIKLAKLFGRKKDIRKSSIIVMENSFHGRTLATISATGSRKVQAGFEPLMRGFVRAPYNDLEAIENIASNDSSVVAILVEPIQGEGGVNIPDAGYLAGLRDICDKNDWLLMLDEIQTGMCRTGEFFGFLHSDIKPDVMTLAKGLGNGFPIGACLAGGKAADIFSPGTHGSTFGGSPLACKVASTVVNLLKDNHYDSKVKALGELITSRLKDKLQDIDGVIEIRGQGLIIGIELNKNCAELVIEALNQGLLINVTADNVVRLLPPFVITNEEALQIADMVSQLIKNFLATATTS
ncbi:MAG: aspartate aminotransferase family protein [Gammaproteobacteria bacterium]|nr:aspartate aminotransferase family protein [Gammaproteobacteria bacterium]